VRGRVGGWGLTVCRVQSAAAFNTHLGSVCGAQHAGQSSSSSVQHNAEDSRETPVKVDYTTYHTGCRCVCSSCPCTTHALHQACVPGFSLSRTPHFSIAPSSCMLCSGWILLVLLMPCRDDADAEMLVPRARNLIDGSMFRGRRPLFSENWERPSTS
jgi:hypothetical protein